jgi:uncharacterized membrane protein (DUF373 family)
MKNDLEEKTNAYKKDPLIRYLGLVVGLSVKLLAILVVFVIFLATIDVAIHLYGQISTSVGSAFSVENLITTLGTFLAVLIAIEIFLNIIFYLKEDAIHVPLVLSTALTAVARKVIVLDYLTVPAISIFALAAVIFSLGITYWLVTKK